MIMAAMLICCLSTTAFAAGLFSLLSGDDLAISAVYEGNGVVSVWVENRSDKDLHFQSVLKLMQWSASEEIAPLAEKNVSFSGTHIPAHSSGTMTIDLSEAYDIAMLETPLAGNDWYYFVLTNNQFAFGQDWMCTVDFAEPSVVPTEYPTPITPAEADAKLIEEIMEELRPYFESYTRPRREKQIICRVFGAVSETVGASRWDDCSFCIPDGVNGNR